MTVLESTHVGVNAGTAEQGSGSHLARRSRYSLVGLDLVAACTSAVVVYGAGVTGALVYRQPSAVSDLATISMPVVWVFVLALHGTYRQPSLEPVPRATRRILQGALSLVATVSWPCLALRYTALVDNILLGIPAATAATVAMRQLVRWVCDHDGDAHVQRALVLGHAKSIADLLPAIQRGHAGSLRVVAACLIPGAGDDRSAALPIPLYPDTRDVSRVAREFGCSAVIVFPCAELDLIRLRQLGWELHDAEIQMLVAPPLAEVAGERVAVLPAGTVPLLHVRAPVLAGPRQVVKGLLDRVAAACLLVIAAPVMVFIAVLIRATSPGPVLFRQSRVGREGAEFTCFKFRTMTVDAEARRAGFAHLNAHRDGPLFKIRRDPRTTRAGAVLRRYSLDELPQLVNVLKGDMSLVGPRPPLPREVAGYDNAVRRRLRVKPGMTGLWQVSGRSELSWAESVRLDLSYVDNWSPALDARILLRTVAAVIRGTGAY